VTTTERVPSISVVVPVFDAAPYLSDALKSVKGQDLVDYEVLVIDDASTDGSAQIASTFDGVRVFRHGENRGAAAARNTGIRLARGRLIAFLDADDRWRPTKLRIQTDYLSRHLDIDYSVTMMQDFLEPGTSRPPWLKADALQRPTLGLLPSTLMVRSEVFGEIGLFDPRREIHEDTDWFARCERAGIARGIIDHVLLDRRVHARNLSNRKPSHPTDLPSFLKAYLERKRSLGVG
jgi:glycosyltransferase involved in cell wall biosynthesis